MTTPIVFEEEAVGCCRAATSSCVMFRQKLQGKLMDPCAEVIAGRLNELSVEEREHIFEDIHGVAHKPDEEPLFVESCLQSLDEAIGKVDGEQRFAYDLAKTIDSQYVTNREIRMKFLRAEEFNVRNAATRFINHFQVKLDLFGKQNLVKDIKYDDLNPEDQESSSSGSHQFLGVKDVKGRAIIFIFPELIKGASPENYLRSLWYHDMIASEDESTQKHGIVVVVIGQFKGECVRWAMKAQSSVVRAVPLRPTSVHICYNQVVPHYFRSMLDILGKKIQPRFRLHLNDSPMTHLYNLQSFGINPQTIPLEPDGRPSRKLFLEVLEKRKILERQTCADLIQSTEKNADIDKKNFDSGIIPNSMDVLLGRGLKHQGNFALDKLIDAELASHQKAPTQFQKTCIVLATVRRIEASGGRFLKRDNKTEQWIIADDNAARDTVSTRFKKRARKLTNASSDVLIDATGSPLRIQKSIKRATVGTTNTTSSTDEVSLKTESQSQAYQLLDYDFWKKSDDGSNFHL